MALCGGTGSAEANDSLPLFFPRASAHPVPPHRTIAEEKQKKIAHIIRSLMKETKKGSKSIIYEGNDRILLSESNRSSGFPVIKQDCFRYYYFDIQEAAAFQMGIV